jgi:hypothetical protein
VCLHHFPKGHGYLKYHRIPWPRIVHWFMLLNMRLDIAPGYGRNFLLFFASG